MQIAKFQTAIDQKDPTAMFLYDGSNKIYANSSGLNKSLLWDGGGVAGTVCNILSQVFPVTWWLLFESSIVLAFRKWLAAQVIHK